MANEDKKDFNAMLHDSKDMPKFQIITDVKSIEKYGGDRMYFAPPVDYDKVMRLVPFGKLLTTGTIRDYFAKKMERISQNQLLQGCLNKRVIPYLQFAYITDNNLVRLNAIR